MKPWTLLVVMCLIGLTLAQTQQLQTIAAECTTEPTGGNGVRHSCDSQISRINAPDGYVFAEKTLKGGEVSGAGSEHWCIPKFENYVEVIANTGITQPKTLTLQTHARGPKGHFSGRGWAKCSYTVLMTKYAP